MNGGQSVPANLNKSDLYIGLEALINETVSQRERECHQYLSSIPEVLLRNPSIDISSVRSGYATPSGISDYIVAAKISAEGGYWCRRAYIWELKAPQCYIFEEDTSNRIKPTRELISAENQLLHYYQDCKGMDIFRDEFEITSPDEIYMGGIIIGSERTKVNAAAGVYDEDHKQYLYKKALRVRVNNFYNCCNIKLYTWNAILERLPKPPIIGKHAESSMQQSEYVMPENMKVGVDSL
jgi:hypothetical protein